MFLAPILSAADVGPVRARSAFPGSSTEECPHLECGLYSSFRARESETIAHVVMDVASREARTECFYLSESGLAGSLSRGLKLSPLSADPGVWRKRGPSEAVS
jgi:hypothetical protein